MSVTIYSCDWCGKVVGVEEPPQFAATITLNRTFPSGGVAPTHTDEICAGCLKDYLALTEEKFRD